MSLVLDAIVVSLLLTAFFAAMGIGLNLIFGVMRIVNLSHGSFFMMGSFMAISLYSIYRLNPIQAEVFIIPLFLGISVPLYFALIPKLFKSKDPEISSFVLFFGIAFVIQFIAISLYGTTFYSLPASSFSQGSIDIYGFYIPFAYFVASAYSIALIIAIYLYLYHTRLGLQTRALMSNRDAAVLSGANVTMLLVIAFAISIAAVASAGAFSSQILFSTSQDMGDIITITSFTIIIIGGLGNPFGTLIGAAVYGFTYEFGSIYFPSWLNVIPFLILLVVILLRPNGVFGGRLREV